jgi:hypothetical protein
MRALVADEQRAFNAFVEVLADHPQTGAVVLEMFARREETPEFQD